MMDEKEGSTIVCALTAGEPSNTNSFKTVNGSDYA